MKTDKITKKDLDYYRELPYGVTLRRDEQGDWIARIEELQGCIAHGKERTEALENLEDVQSAWIEDAIAAGDAIPEPEPREEGLPSGKWLQRVPRSLHRKLAELAKREGVSLNQLTTSMLAEAAGRRYGSVSALVGRHTCEASNPIDAIYFEQEVEWQVQVLKQGKRYVQAMKDMDILATTSAAALPTQISEFALKGMERAIKGKKELAYKE
jgi:antitoxin HicB